MNENLQSEIDVHLSILRKLIAPSGLFLAAADVGVATGYDKSWLRDNFYEVMAFEETGDFEVSQKTWHALLDIFLKHEDKINWAIEKRPQFSYQYIHARYNPETFEEFWEEWGNKQNDAVGEILFKIGDLEQKGVKIIETQDEKEIVQRLVDYLLSIEYWDDGDNGVWEEYEEVHASSVGACVAGLKSVSKLDIFKVPDHLIQMGEEALKKLLPRESKSKFTDLALLSLIYPFNVVSGDMAREIVRHLEYHLKKDRGVIRYKNDRYYNKNIDEVSEEAEWCFGFPWLSIIYGKWGEDEIAREYLDMSYKTIYNDQIPELYYSDSDKPNENTPLGWAESLFVVALIRSGK